MTEYTWDDIIINPNSEEAKNAIGKECYFSTCPKSVLAYASANCYPMVSVLKDIDLNSDSPFVSSSEVTYNCIIVMKKEPKPKRRSKYIPYQITTRNLAEYWEKLKGRAFIIDDEECTLIETVTRIYKDFDAKEADINNYSVSMLCDEARWLDTGEPIGEEIEDE